LTGLKSNKKMIEALAQENKNIFSMNYAKRYRLLTTSTTQKAVNVLLNESVVEKHGNIYYFTDPFFKSFLLRLKA